jgi:hypothetical protein
MKVAVITSLVNPKKPIELSYNTYFDDVDYFAYTCRSDNISVDDKIKRIFIENESWDGEYSARRSAKIAKMMAHVLLPDYAVYVWHDATHELVIPKKKVIEYVTEHDAAMFKHPHRDCVYVEAQEVLDGRLDYQEILVKTVEYLKTRGLPFSYGLFEMTAFIRRNNEKCNKAFTLWHSMMSRLSSRDQLTFMECVRTFDLSINTLPGTAQMYYGNNDIIKQTKPSLRVGGVV